MSAKAIGTQTIVLPLKKGGCAAYFRQQLLWIVKDNKGKIKPVYMADLVDRLDMCVQLLGKLVDSPDDGLFRKTEWGTDTQAEDDLISVMWELRKGLKKLGFTGRFAPSKRGVGYAMVPGHRAKLLPQFASDWIREASGGSTDAATPSIQQVLERFHSHKLLIVDDVNEDVGRLAKIHGRLGHDDRTQLGVLTCGNLKRAQAIIDRRESIVVILNPAIAPFSEALEFIIQNNNSLMIWIIYSTRTWWDELWKTCRSSSSLDPALRTFAEERLKSYHRLPKELSDNDLHTTFVSQMAFCMVEFLIKALSVAVKHDYPPWMDIQRVEKLADNSRVFFDALSKSID